MSRTAAVLNDRMEPERTRELLKGEWLRLGGPQAALDAYVAVFRSVRPTLTADEAIALSYQPQSKPVRGKRLTSGDEITVCLRRLLAVAQAVAHVDHFIEEDRPRIVEALRLADEQAALRAMLKAHFRTRPEDTQLGSHSSSGCRACTIGLSSSLPRLLRCAC